jgi:hypothetical protein
LNRNGGAISLFNAFSSREPVSTSLENALIGVRADLFDVGHLLESLASAVVERR